MPSTVAMPRPLSLDAFCAQIAPHIFADPNEPSANLAHRKEPSANTKYPDKPSADVTYLRLLKDWDRAPRSNEAAPFPKTLGPDNTVGPVPKISGYVFNTLQTNSVAHVPNTNGNLMNEDTHICDLNLYETKLVHH